MVYQHCRVAEPLENTCSSSYFEVIETNYMIQFLIKFLLNAIERTGNIMTIFGNIYQANQIHKIK